eukprot:s1393_g7.t1
MADDHGEADHAQAQLLDACERGDFGAARCALQNGASPNGAGRHGRTPLHLAVWSSILDPPSSVKLSQLLIQSAADVNARDRDSNTPLHLCALSNEGIWPARLLLAYKADPILRNRQGLLPSDLIMCHTVPCVADGCEVDRQRSVAKEFFRCHERQRFREVIGHVKDGFVFLPIEELTFQPAWLASSGLPFSRHLCVVSEDVLQQAPTLHAILEHLAEVFNLQPVVPGKLGQITTYEKWFSHRSRGKHSTSHRSSHRHAVPKSAQRRRLAAMDVLHEDLLDRLLHCLPGRGWRALGAATRAARAALRSFLAERGEVKLTQMAFRCWPLEPIALACPRLQRLSLFQVDLPLIPVTARSAWCQGFEHLGSLQRLDLVECRFVNDEVLDLIFAGRCGSSLQTLDVSWSGEFSDGPWSRAPVSLKHFYGIGCEHLTERVMVHLGARCPELTLLHASRHLNWIGSTRSELLTAFSQMKCLEDLALQDIPLDDELLNTLAQLQTLQQLQLWSFSTGPGLCMTGRGVQQLAFSLTSLKKLSLDSFVFESAQPLHCLSSHCPALCELLLEGTQPCSIGTLGHLCFSNLVKLRLASCGVAGQLDCSAMPLLRYLWLFDNTGLTKIRGSGQALEVLNLGSTGCLSIEGFEFQRLVMLDLSVLRLRDDQLSPILRKAPNLIKAVLGENFISPELLVEFLTSARQLKNLSLCCSDASGSLTLLSMSLSERPPADFAVKLQLMELYEASCTLLASSMSVEASRVGGSAVIKRAGGVRVRLWVVDTWPNSRNRSVPMAAFTVQMRVGCRCKISADRPKMAHGPEPQPLSRPG